jgi:type I restriction-modification system DNA methylase subunit
MPPKKTAVTTETVVPASAQQKTKIESALWQVRELCRKHHLQTLGKESLANQIYQDLLFIYHVPRLCREGILDISIQRIGDGKINEVSYASLLSLKEPELINASFKRLWKELQQCVLEDLFYGREFILFTIEKKKPGPYMALLLDLFRYFASINLEGYDSNAGYTYFKKDLNKAIAKTFGQFYTPSTVTYSVVKLVDPKIGEKTLDPSCGSCSFLAEAANYMVKQEGVDIKTGFIDLYGTEVEPNIFAEGVMNMFINFGILPDMKNRIREVDALLDMAKSEDQFDKIIANPPFGADASTFHEFYFKNELEEKGKRMVKKIILNPDVKCEIPFTKTKESAVLFFQFIVQKLKKGGKAGVVMSATILNDGYKDMIEWFLNCCSLEKVVINPAGTFKEQGTGIETFSFIFTKGKPTTTVEIVMLDAEDVAVRTLTLDQIKEAGWKLQLKEEEKKAAYTGVYELKKIGEICELLSGKTNNERGVGDIPFYDSNGQIGVVNKHLFDGEFVITARVLSVGSVNYVYGKFWAGDNTINIKIKDNTIMSTRFFYYWLLSNTYILKELSSGIKPYIRKSDVAEILMPIPPIESQQEIVTNLDRIFADPQDMKDCLAFTDKAMDLMLKDPTGKQLEDVLGGLRLKRAYLTDAASVKCQMAAVVRSVGARGFQRKKLGDLLEIEGGDYITKNSETTGEYPVYGGGAASYHINRFNREPTCVINKDGMSASCVQMVNTRFFLNHHGWTLKLKSAELVEKFLHWQLYFRSDEIFTLATGSCQKGLNQKEFTQFMIYIPPLPIQHEVLAILNEMEAELVTLEQMAAKAEQRAKFILNGYLTPAPTQVINTAVAESDEVPQNEVVENVVEAPKPAKRILKLKKTSATT